VQFWTLKNKRHFPNLVYFLAAMLMRLWRRTCRLHVDDPQQLMQRFEHEPAIFVVWHNRLVFLVTCMPARLRRRCVGLASSSRDGQYAAEFIRQFGLDMERGSSSRGGFRALVRLQSRLRAGSLVALTPDGPRGPRYTAQPGAVILASRMAVPIVPVSLNALRRWELKGWDRTQLPKPFSRLQLRLGEPLLVPPQLDEAAVQQQCRRLEEALMLLTDDRDKRG